MEEQLRQLETPKALLIGLIVAAVYYFVMYDDGEVFQTQIVSTDSQLTQMRADKAKMEETLKDAEQHREISRKLGEEMDAVLRAVPEKYNSLELMKVLSDEAKVVGASIVDLKPIEGRYNRGNQQSEQSPFVPVTVEVSLKGTFNQVMLFMSNLTKVSKIILVDNLTLELSEPNKVFEAASPAINYKARFKAYRYEANSGAGQQGGRRGR